MTYEAKEKIKRIVIIGLPILLSIVPYLVYFIISRSYNMVLVELFGKRFYLSEFLANGYCYALFSIVATATMFVIEIADLFKEKARKVAEIVLYALVIIPALLILLAGIAIGMGESSTTLRYNLFDGACAFGTVSFVIAYPRVRKFFTGKITSFLSAIVAFGACLGLGFLTSMLGKLAGWLAYVAPAALYLLFVGPLIRMSALKMRMPRSSGSSSGHSSGSPKPGRRYGHPVPPPSDDSYSYQKPVKKYPHLKYPDDDRGSGGDSNEIKMM